MANITVTINGGESTFARAEYPNRYSETFTYANVWTLYKDGQYYCNHLDPKGLTFEVTDLHLDETIYHVRNVGFGDFYDVTRIYRYKAHVTYPDDWVNVSVQHGFYHNWPNDQYPNAITYTSLGSVSPIIRLAISNPGYGNNYITYRVWPSIGTIDEEGLVSYPILNPVSTYDSQTQTTTVSYPLPNYAEAQQGNLSVDSVLSHLLWDWGDGTIDTIPLSLTQKVLNTYYTNNSDGSLATNPDGTYIYSYDYISIGNLSAPVTHKFTPDENGDGTGVPISIVAVDSVGRKSPPVYSKIGPHLEVEKTIDETKNQVVLKTKKSYGRTGKITTKIYSGQNLWEENILPNYIGTEEGAVADQLSFVVPLALGGRYTYYAQTKDDAYLPAYNNVFYYNGGYSAMEPEVLNQDTGGRDDYRFGKVKWDVHRPPFSALPWLDGSSLIIRENGGNPSRSVFIRKFVNPKNFPQFVGFTQPRLFQNGAEIYCAGRAEDGTTGLWRSQTLGESWEKLSTMWTPEYYHAEVVSLIGGGAASLAMKRVKLSETTYDVELWFRKTFDLANWEAEPVKVIKTNSAIPLEGTFGVYPLLINEADAGRAPRLLAGTNSNITHKSDDMGATWSAL